jgi:uncharacterized repeat protein (TIGR02543 family)
MYKQHTSKRFLALLLTALLCFSFFPSMTVNAEPTGKTITVTHSKDLGEDLKVQTSSIASGEPVALDTTDNSKFYRIEQYYAKNSPDNSSYVEKGHKLLKITITHGGNTKEIYIPEEAPSSVQSTQCATDLNLTGTFTVQISMAPTNQKRIGFLYSALTPTTDITVNFVWDTGSTENFSASIAESENGSADAQFLENSEEAAVWKLDATPNTDFAFVRWESKAADAEDSEYITDNEATAQGATATVTLTGDMTYRAVFTDARLTPITPTFKQSQSNAIYSHDGDSIFSTPSDSIQQPTIYPGQIVQSGFRYTLTGPVTSGQALSVRYYAGSEAEGEPLVSFNGKLGLSSEGVAFPPVGAGTYSADLKPFIFSGDVTQITVYTKLGEANAVTKTFNLSEFIGTPGGDLGATGITSPIASSYAENYRTYDVLTFADETTGKLIMYAAGSNGVLEYGLNGFTYMTGIEVPSANTTPGYVASLNGTKDKLIALGIDSAGSSALWQYTPEAGVWSEIESSRAIGYGNDADSASTGIIISEDEAYRSVATGNGNNKVWDGTEWSVYSAHNFTSFIRANADTYYASALDGLYKHTAAGWTKVSDQTGTIAGAGYDGSVLVKTGNAYYKVSADGNTATLIDDSYFSANSVINLGIDYAGNIYAFLPYGVYKKDDSNWILQAVGGKVLAETGTIEKAFNPLPNVTLFTGSGGAYYLKAGETTVTFDPMTDDQPTTFTGKISTAVTLPAAPTSDGQIFTGWYHNRSNTNNANPLDLMAMPAKSLTVYAHWASENTGGDPFADARAAALTQLNTARAAYTQSDYTTSEWAELQAAYNAGKTAIANAADYTAIQNALNGAKSSMASVTASNAGIATVAVSVEKFTLGQGYIIEPVLVTIPKGERAAKILTDQIVTNVGSYTGASAAGSSYHHTGSIDSAFYLSAIKDVPTNNDPPIPQYLKDAIKGNTRGGYYDPKNEDGYLGEFDYTSDSGWMYCVNGSFPGVGFSDWKLKTGDVMRVQYTLVGLGADLAADNSSWGSGAIKPLADKDNLTWRVAEINTNNEDKNAFDNGNGYANAVTVLSKLDSTQQQVDDALAALGGKGNRPAQGASGDTSVTSVTVSGVTAEIMPPNIFSVTLPASKSLASLTAGDIIITPRDPAASVTGLATADGGRTWTFTVIAADGDSTTTFTLNVSGGSSGEVARTDDAGVASVSINGIAAAVNASGSIFSAELPDGVDISSLTAANIAIVLSNPKASVTAGPTTANGGATWTFIVTAEDGETTANYTLNLTVAAPGTDDPAADIVVEDDENDTGIFVTAKPGILPPDTGLQIDPLNVGKTYDTAKAALQTKGGSFTLFDIALIRGGKEIQPNGAITISIPVPNGYTAAKCKVFHINDDGSATDMNAVVKNDVLVFTTNHLSPYAIWQLETPSDTGDNPGPGVWKKQANGTWKYLTDGIAATGWVRDKGAWYYLDKTTGIMKTGWVRDNGIWYYLARDGKMRTGWIKDKGAWYYLAGNGKMVAAKWLKDTDGTWYYLGGNGKMLTGKHKIGGKTYAFKGNGVWAG